MGVVVEMDEHIERSEDDHLRDEHALVRVEAYVRDPDAAQRKKTGAAARMARMRERKKEAGLVAVELPAAIAEAIKAEGAERVLSAVVDAAPVDREAEAVGVRVLALRGWRAWLVRALIR